jgi:hypothetical protein
MAGKESRSKKYLGDTFAKVSKSFFSFSFLS